MKQLKKILIVIAMLALLVASFAIVIGAEEEKEVGTVAKLEKYIASIEAELEKDPTDTAKHQEEVTSAYGYIHDSEIDWTEASGTPEYAAAVAKLDGYCIQVANALCAKIPSPSADVDASMSSAKGVYSFFANCSPAEETEGYAEFIAAMTEKNSTITEAVFANFAMPKADSATAYSEANTARTNLRKIYKHLDACPIVTDELIAKYRNTSYDLVTFMLDEYDEFMTAADAKDSTQYFKIINDIRTIEAFVVDIPTVISINEIDGYAATMDRMNAALANAEATLDAKRNALDSLAPFEEYDYSQFFNRSYDGNLTKEEQAALSPDEKVAYDEDNAHLPYPNAAGDHKTDRVFESLYGRGENGYLKFMYGSQAIHHYTYFDLRKASGMEEYGLVVEWDMRINDTSAYPIVMYGVDDVRKEGGRSVFASFFNTAGGTDNFVKLRNCGDNMKYSITSVDKNEWVFVEDAVVTDVWTHFTLTYDPETRMGKLYVNYQEVLDIYHFNHDKISANFRFGPSTVTNWEGWDLDNTVIYYGTAFRITDKFDKMTKNQQFEYFVNYAYDGNGNPEEYLARNNAYNKAKVLVDGYSSTDPVVQKFNSINYAEDIKYPAMNQNLGILTEKVAKLKDLDVTTENIKKINDAIADINSFVNKNAALIDKADSINKETDENRYQTQMSIVYSTEADVQKLVVVQEFVEAVKRFERAITLSARTRYATIAAEIYARAEYEIEENREFIANDPVVKMFEWAHNNQLDADNNRIPATDSEGEPTPGYIADDSEEFENLFEYYNNFVNIIADREKLENAKNIINAMNIVTGMDGYEATDEFFAANYEEIKSYTLLVRGYVNSGKYDNTYPGIDAAIEAFRAMDPYFFEALQLEHIATLEKMIAKYNEVNTITEKSAVVNSVKAYFESADTVLNNTAITKAVRMRTEDEKAALEKLQTQNDVYEAELIGYEDSYLDVLEQQTQYFINIINHMDSVVVFSEIEKLFADASVYYYGINLNVEGALEAAEKYADYREYIASVNENNEAFAMYVKELHFASEYEGIEKRDEMFAALKNASVYADFVDAGDERVAADLEFYYAQLEAYENNIAAVEGAIYESVQFANALRTSKLPVTVLSVIGKLINN